MRTAQKNAEVPCFQTCKGRGQSQWLLEMICCEDGRWELKRALFSEFSLLQDIHVDQRVAEQWDGLES